jgi:peptide subunit release factor 1 (eRF1)
MVASAKTVRERTQAIIREINVRDMASLMDHLENEAGAQNLGITGLPGSLQTLQKGQVQTLLICEGFQQPGKQCTHCAHLTLSEDEACPYCGGPLVVKDDIIQEMADRAFEQGCQVVFLDGTAGSRLERLGQVGALLRFKLGGAPG